MSLPLVLAFSASYSVNGTLAPVPLGTLKGDCATYGGVPGPFSASAGDATDSAITVPSAVPTAATSAVSFSRRLPAAVRRPGGLGRRDIACMPFPGGVELPPRCGDVDGRRRLGRRQGWLPRQALWPYQR